MQNFVTEVNKFKVELIACGESRDTVSTYAFGQLRDHAPRAAIRDFTNECDRLESGTGEMSVEQKYDALHAWLVKRLDSYCKADDSEDCTIPDNSGLVVKPRSDQFESDNSVFYGHGNQSGGSRGWRPIQGRNQNYDSNRRSNYNHGRSQPYNKSNRQHGGRQGRNSSNSNRKGNGGPNGQYRYYKCIYCQTDEHAVKDCPKKLVEKIEWLEKNQRCKRCCFPEHTANNCTSPAICRNCALHGYTAKHNTTICPEKAHPDLWKSRRDFPTPSPATLKPPPEESKQKGGKGKKRNEKAEDKKEAKMANASVHYLDDPIFDRVPFSDAEPESDIECDDAAAFYEEFEFVENNESETQNSSDAAVDNSDESD